MLLPNDFLFGFFCQKNFLQNYFDLCSEQKKNIPIELRTDIFEKNSKDFKSKLRLQINYICIRKRFKCLKKYYFIITPTRHTTIFIIGKFVKSIL